MDERSSTESLSSLPLPYRTIPLRLKILHRIERKAFLIGSFLGGDKQEPLFIKLQVD